MLKDKQKKNKTKKYKKNERNKTVKNRNFKLTKKDYIEILNFYILKLNKEIIKENKKNNKFKNTLDLYNYKSSLKDLKNKTEKIIAEKLCRCIKKVNVRIKDEPRSIGICNYSVIDRKKLGIYKFTCKNKPRLDNIKDSDKINDNMYKKTRDHIHLHKNLFT